MLNMLRGPPFKPMIKAQLKYVTFKTVFLLSLAAGRRRSEIHAIEKKSMSWTEDKSHMTCRLVPQFVAKTQLANDGRSLHSFRLESLGNFVSKDREEMKLCPVRATFMYLERTKDMRTGKQLLFVSYKQGFTKEIAKVTISSWLKKTISMAYAKSSDEDFQLKRTKSEPWQRRWHTIISYPYTKLWKLAPGNVTIHLCRFIISRGAEGPGREILQRPPVRLSVCLSVRLSVTFSFRTVTQKRIAVFSRNFASHGGVLYSF